MRAAAIATLALLAGCATPQAPVSWYKAGASQEQTQRDVMTCRQLGMQSASTHGLSGNLFVEVWVRDEASKCLRGLGYQSF